jgi:hypothetical protein
MVIYTNEKMVPGSNVTLGGMKCFAFACIYGYLAVRKGEVLLLGERPAGSRQVGARELCSQLLSGLWTKT